MRLNDALTQVFFSRVKAPETFELVLRLKGAEITDPGYSSVKAGPKSWRVSSGEATIEARFGPFPSGARFDEAAILADGAEIHAERMPGQLPPGGDFAWTPTVAVVG